MSTDPYAPDYTQVPYYKARAFYQPALGMEALNVLKALVATPKIKCGGVVVQQLDPASGEVLYDLTPFVVNGGNNTVTKDCTAEVSTSLNLEFSNLNLQWGSAQVLVTMLLKSEWYEAGQYQGFPLGVYVLTSPSVNLQPGSIVPVTGYEKTYLLQSSLPDSVSFNSGSTYLAGVTKMFVQAGLLVSGQPLNTVCNYPGAWASKTLPTTVSYALFGDTTATATFLDAVNGLLLASGMQPLYCDQLGNYTISPLPTPAAATPAWTFAGSVTEWSDPAFPSSSDCVVSDTDRSISRDVYGVPNEWYFIQQGLTVAPSHNDGRDGRYVVENTVVQPSDQTSVGRVLRSTQFINASGQADLIAQGNAIVQAQLAKSEAITFNSTGWPVAWQYDVFRYTDQTLPATDVRKVQCQGFTLPLDGSEMQWTTLVVGPS